MNLRVGTLPWRVCHGKTRGSGRIDFDFKTPDVGMQTSTESEGGGILTTTRHSPLICGKARCRYRFKHICIITRYRLSLINLVLREVRAQTVVATV